jgi:hypothetical protein
MTWRVSVGGRTPELWLFNRSYHRMYLNQRRHRKKSTAMAILEIEAPDARRPTDYITSTGRFTLKDLLMTNLRSTNHPTATAALQLFKTLLQLHSELCTEKLLLVIHDPKSTSYPSPYLSTPPPPTEPPPHGEDIEPSADPPFMRHTQTLTRLIRRVNGRPAFTSP